MSQQVVVLKIRTGTLIKATVVVSFTAAAIRVVAAALTPHVENFEKKLKQDLVEAFTEAAVPNEEKKATDGVTRTSYTK
jgi:hypothetical protein